MGKWSLLALQGWADPSPSDWARRQMRACGHHSPRHITELQSWGNRKPLTLVYVPPTLFPSKAEFGLLKFCTLIKL